MRLASLVPEEIPIEIWDENVRDLPMDTVREGDLVGITSMTVTIERAERIALALSSKAQASWSAGCMPH